MSVSERSTPNSALSAGPPSPPDTPFPDVPPPTLTIMLSRIDGRPCATGKSAYTVAGSTSSSGPGKISRIGRGVGQKNRRRQVRPDCEAPCMEEVRRPDDDELCGFVDERDGQWHALTVFAATLGAHDERDHAVAQVLGE